MTASEQAGKVWSAMAFVRTAKAVRNRSSCVARLRTRKEKPDSWFGSVKFEFIFWTDGVIAKEVNRGKPGVTFRASLVPFRLEASLRRHVKSQQT